MLKIERPDLEQLSALLLEHAGLKIAADGFHGLKLALTARMPVLGMTSAGDYIRRLRGTQGADELRALMPLVTVGYTEFFRDARQFKALSIKLLPELLGLARAEGRRLAIWSAGCATGEEPYSIAMALIELGAAPEEVDLRASDLNPAAIENAKAGRYPSRRLLGLPTARLKKFFEEDPEGGYRVTDQVKGYVQFAPHNLAAPTFEIQADSLDIILCRNVIIYFDLPTIRALMERFFQAMRNTGYLLLGYSESLFKVYDRFEIVEIEGTFIYRRARPKPKVEPLPPLFVPRKDVPPPKAGPAPARLARPAPPPPAPARVEPSLVAGPPGERLEKIVQMLDQGTFKAALTELEALAKAQPNDLAVLLTLGNVCSLLRMDDRSDECFRQALAKEPLCVEARVFSAIAGMQKNQLDAARAELSKALFLEPTLALGHYLLAQVQERQADADAARRSYRNCLAQLKQPQRTLAGYYPDIPDSAETVARAAKYALASLEEG